MMDRINRQIISVLRRDGRYSYAKLAKELGVNVATVTKRVNVLLEDAVIDIKAVPNPFKMGYQANAFIALDVDLTKLDHVCAELVDNPNISLIVTTFGRFDILLIADFCNWEMLQDFVQKRLPQIEGVNHVDTFLVSEIKKRYQGMFEKEDGNTPSAIDETDRKLIEELSRDGRCSYASLAQRLDVSLATVSRRVSSLVRKNVIKFTAVPNPSKLGYSANSFVALDAALSEVDNICSALSIYPEVHLVMTLMNGFNVLVGVHLPNPEMLITFIKDKIAHMNGVLNIETFIRAEIVKRNYGLFDFESLVQ